MKIVYLGAHSILEYDEVKLFHSLGHEVFSVGAYIHPSMPLDSHRPPLPEVPEVPHLIAAVDALGQQGHEDTLMAAKDMGLPDPVLEWADVIICAAYEHRWIQPNWARLRDKRVIWRTIGQSAHPNEWMMRPLRLDGMQIVRYSPKERNIPEFAGEDALIRFYKDPAEWQGWTGEGGYVAIVAQNLYRRSLADDDALQAPGYQWTSYSYWKAATDGLPAKPAGPGSLLHGGVGALSYDELRSYLQKARCYINTGTQPASYTLGLIEAMMTGVPTYSIGAEWYKILPYGPAMFEAGELALGSSNEPADAREFAQMCLARGHLAATLSKQLRAKTIETFGMETIGAQWNAFLGATTSQPEPTEAIAA